MRMIIIFVLVYYYTTTLPHTHLDTKTQQPAPSAKVKCKVMALCARSASEVESDVFRPKGRDKCARGEAASHYLQNAEKVKKNLQKKGLIS